MKQDFSIQYDKDNLFICNHPWITVVDNVAVAFFSNIHLAETTARERYKNKLYEDAIAKICRHHSWFVVYASTGEVYNGSI